ncbi:DUF6923 family protein [Pelagibacterium sp. H642]|uniref:DUF7507 domain-containing protein n=1 Tax=Pelagibacterium sp. H642 TaxID=1881069 RepID=UPI002815CF2B|nr:hypothetical protein [Pelagibacterium sp. H642]WMT92759.1 hypothetical protein NO934_18365 [Pelagibacterium sp. H642]
MALSGGAMAAPGTPGVPQPPIQIYVEDFQNRPGPSPIVKLDDYTGVTSQGYTAHPNWLVDCNGWIASANQATNGAAQASDCRDIAFWNQSQQLAWALGLHTGQAAPRDNYAVTAYTAGEPGAGLIEFETASNIPFPIDNRFVTFGVDVAAVNCNVSAPSLQFSLLDEGSVATPVGSAINACTSPRTFSIPALGTAAARTVNTGSYTSNEALLISGSSVGVRMVNNNGSGVGNDHAFDNITILDATPQLDKEFVPTNLATGAASTLTFTITNTSEEGAKNGWSFTDELSTGLVVASDETSTTCPAGVINAPVGGSTIDVSGNLTAGMASCTVTVPVTSTTAGTYTNDASNITSSVGVNPPGSSSVTFGTQPNFVCSPTMYLGINAPTQLVSVDTSTNPFAFPPIGAPYAQGYNAMGYDPVTNYIYATRWDAGTNRWRLLRIGSNGSVSDQGPITGGGINSSTGIASGAVGADGYYYVKNNGVDPLNVMWRIDLVTRTAVSIGLSASVASADLAWHNGLLYGHDQSNGNFYSINPVSGVVNLIGPSGIVDSFGSLIDASNGVFGRLNNGGFYRFDLTTGVATLISTSPVGTGDGAKCPLTPVSLPADTQITKTDGSDTYLPGEDVVYTIVVSNNGPFGAQNVVVEDPLPAGITDATWTCAAAGGGVCGAASGTGGISDEVDLPPDASVTYTLTMSVPADFAVDLVNTATVTNPSDVPDPDTGNNSATDTNELADPALEIEKTGTLNDLNGNALIDAGETITYSFLVTNIGNIALDDVTVDDPLLADAGVSVTPGPQTLEPGGTATFTATYQPTQANIDSGSVENTATGTATPPDPSDPPIESPPDTVVVPPNVEPGLSIAKTGTLNDLNGNELIDAGETITYSFLVTNTGAVTLTDVTVDDPLLVDAGVNLDQGPQTLSPGASFTFTATYQPTQADIDAGSVENTAHATGTPPDPSDPPIESPPDTSTVPPNEAAGLSIAKTGRLNDLNGNDLIDPGETITYSFLVRNTGAVTLTNVTVDDPLLEDAGVSLDQGPQTLAPGGSFTFTATYQPTQADIDSGSVENTATGTGTPPDPSDPPIESPPDTVVVPPSDETGLEIEKTGTLNDLNGNELIDAGETITYSFLVRNTGAVTLTNVTVDDPLLSGAGVSLDQGPQTLAPGASFTFTATYQPTQADIDAGTVENTATATGTPPDPSDPPIESPPDTVVVPPNEEASLSIEKTGTLNDANGNELIDAGETITYAFLVTNTGAVTLTDVTVDDPLLQNAGIDLDQGPQMLAPGASFTFTATYQPTQADIDAGNVENTATATATPPDPSDPPVESPPDTVVVPPNEDTGLTIEKTGQLDDVNGNGLLDPGEAITYAFLVTNTGAVSLTDVTVDDPLLIAAGVDLDQGPQTLAPGASFTFTATYQPTPADIETGSVENTATGTGTPPGGGDPIESSPDTVTVPSALPSLEIVKTGEYVDVNGNGATNAGDELHYTLVVTNTGNVVIEDVSPQDPGPTFNGLAGTGTLSPFTPDLVTLDPGEQQSFTAVYTLAQGDVDNGVGLTDGVENTATALGYTNGDSVTGTPVESDESQSFVSLPAVETDLSVSKVASLRYIRRGEEAPFVIRITNNSGSTAADLTVIDTLPSGFRYVEGSASIDGVEATPVVEGLRVIFEDVSVPANAQLEIRLRMLALSSAGPGEHVNRAGVTDSTGRQLAPEATATVEIVAEPVFDCSEIIGRVFDDRNRNGYQDEGEPGLPGVRLATVNGELITTDAHGRFSVPCAALPDQRIGSNFILKLDIRTLPTGYRLTTENPRVVRLTAGKMTELNFGASIGRVVRLDLQDGAFEPGLVDLRPEWEGGIDDLIGFLAQEQSVLRLTYIEAGADPDLAQDRLESLQALIAERWRATSGQYRLEIEMRVETGQ